MADNDEDRGKSRRLGVKDRGWSDTIRVLSGQMIRRLGDVVCDPHHTRGGDEKRGFSGLASKSVAMVCQWFDLKITATVSWFVPQNQGWWFGDLGLKISATVSWFAPQNQVGGDLLVCASKPMSGWRRCEDTCQHPVTCFVVKQVGLGFPSFALKLVEEWRRVVHVASSQRSRESEANDGRFSGVGCGVVEVRQNYPSLVVIFLLAHRVSYPIFMSKPSTHRMHDPRSIVPHIWPKSVHR
jgi:hypothetical protein